MSEKKTQDERLLELIGECVKAKALILRIQNDFENLHSEMLEIEKDVRVKIREVEEFGKARNIDVIVKYESCINSAFVASYGFHGLTVYNDTHSPQYRLIHAVLHALPATWTIKNARKVGDSIKIQNVSYKYELIRWFGEPLKEYKNGSIDFPYSPLFEKVQTLFLELEKITSPKEE